MPIPRLPINLALQGGGAHGAFTWGVLDRLLEADVALATVSATSAGAVNAIAMAAGLAQGGPEGARRKLAEIWEAITRAGVPEMLRLHPFLAGLARIGSGQAATLAGMLSPSDLNPFDLNPLRKLLLEHIDFAGLARSPPLKLLIAATDVDTGRPRLFTTPEVTADVVLASACLPTLHRAVRIGDRHYWDGGYSANPELIALAADGAVRDTLIVLLNPMSEADVPTKVREIANRMGRITFNQPFLAQVACLEALRTAARGPFRGWLAGQQARTVARHRFHLIEAAAYTSRLAPDSKLQPDRGMLELLFKAGREEASLWLEQRAALVGRKPGVDLAARFLSISESH